MKIKYNSSSKNMVLVGGKVVLDFTIIDSITKTHFKKLMRLASLYKSSTKSGHITQKNKDEFLDLIEKIEKSNDKVCAKSHAKSIEKAKAKYSKKQHCNHDDLGSLGYKHGSTIKCPYCGEMTEVW